MDRRKFITAIAAYLGPSGGAISNVILPPTAYSQM